MLHYEKKGKGPAVVLLHGLPSNHTIWHRLTDELSHQFSFILPDFPGAGNSPSWETPVTLAEVAEEVRAIMAQENIPQTIMAGHSMGGYTVMAFAQAFPEQVKAISLIHSSTAADTEEKKQIRLKSIDLIRKSEHAKNLFNKALVKQLFDEGFARHHPEIVQQAIETGNQLSSQTLIQFYKALMMREDTSHLLPEAPYPIQWILGDNDTATDLEATLPLVHTAPVNDVCIYPDCGHMSMLEMPERLTDDLWRFWRYADAL